MLYFDLGITVSNDDDGDDDDDDQRRRRRRWKMNEERGNCVRESGVCVCHKSYGSTQVDRKSSEKFWIYTKR